jgi:hypothetical protein
VINQWLQLFYRVGWLGLEAQRIIALRCIRLAGGGSVAQTETIRMFSEKIFALSEAQRLVLLGVLTSQPPLWILRRTMKPFNRQIGKNRRRLFRR